MKSPVTSPPFHQPSLLARLGVAWLFIGAALAPAHGATGFMASARGGHTATVLPNGNVLVAGGIGNSGVIAGAELFDSNTGAWGAAPALATARVAHTATLLPNGGVLIVGGWLGGPLTTAELYHPATGLRSVTGSLAAGHYFHTATLLPSGRVLVTGGGNASVELYDPGSGTWSTTNSLAVGRNNHIATLLADGRVLVAGGDDGNSAMINAELYDPASSTWSAAASLADQWQGAHRGGRQILFEQSTREHGALRCRARILPRVAAANHHGVLRRKRQAGDDRHRL